MNKKQVIFLPLTIIYMLLSGGNRKWRRINHLAVLQRNIAQQPKFTKSSKANQPEIVFLTGENGKGLWKEELP